MGLLVVQNLIAGVLIGCVYGLVSVGLSLLFGVMKFVNFAHGAVMMLSMYFMLIVVRLMKIDPFIGIIFVLPASFFVGYILAVVCEPIVIRERKTGSHTALLLTLGLSLIITNGAQIVFGPEFYNIETVLSGQTIVLSGVIINVGKLVAAGITMVIFCLVFIFLKFTDLGRAVRAVSQDMDSALLMGVGERQIFRIGFGISTSIVGIAGILILPFYSIYPTVGDVFQLKAFIIVILGGLGSIMGTLIGGLIIGVVEALGATAFNASYAQMCVFAVFLIILVLKPKGLFGKELT